MDEITAIVNLTPCLKCDGEPRLGSHGVGHVARVSRLPVPEMTEEQLHESVMDLCRLFGLYTYHTRDSRGSSRGYPDLVIVGTSILYAELKTDRGRLTVDQVAWQRAILAADGRWALWRPADWHSGEIRQVLTGMAPPRPVRGQVIRGAAELPPGGGHDGR
jgi:hypothetical protein